MSRVPERSAKGLAGRLSRVSPSATAALFAKVAELRRGGVDLCALSVGEPDFDPPPHVLEATKAALDAGDTRYTLVPGTRALREAIAARSLARRGVEHDPEDIVVGAGAKHILFNLALSLYDPGDRVLIPAPAWVSYAQHAELCGATPVYLPTRAADGFVLDPEVLRSALSQGARAVVLCAPGNPTGAVYDVAQLSALADVLRAHDCTIITDEIYSELTYDGQGQRSLLSVAPDLRARTVVVDGVSKTYAMTGFRVGWGLCPPHIARALVTLQGQATTNITAFAQQGALAAVSGDQAAVERMRLAYERRRDRLLAGVRRLPGLACGRPGGAFYLFVDVRGLYGRRWAGGAIRCDEDVAQFWLEAARVAVVPGSAFAGPGFVRLSYAVSESVIDTALQRLGDAHAGLR